MKAFVRSKGVVYQFKGKDIVWKVHPKPGGELEVRVDGKQKGLFKEWDNVVTKEDDEEKEEEEDARRAFLSQGRTVTSTYTIPTTASTIPNTITWRAD